MSFVIKFTDGTFNYSGFGVPIEGATIYSTIEDANAAVQSLMDVESIQAHTQPKFISIDALIDVIRGSSKTQKITTSRIDLYNDCVRSVEEHISYVDSNELIRLLLKM